MELKQLKPLVNSDLWNLYLSYIEQEYNLVITAIGGATEPSHIYRLQGEMKHLKAIKNLRDKVNAG